MARVPTAYVLASFALLAYCGDEPVANTVGQLLERAQHGTIQLFLWLVNLGGVNYITERVSAAAWLSGMALQAIGSS